MKTKLLTKEQFKSPENQNRDNRIIGYRKIEEQAKPLNTGVVMPRFVLCTLCSREVRLTNDGRYFKHGHRYSVANKTYLGLPRSGTQIETSPPCIKSGEKYVASKNGA